MTLSLVRSFVRVFSLCHALWNCLPKIMRYACAGCWMRLLHVVLVRNEWMIQSFSGPCMPLIPPSQSPCLTFCGLTHELYTRPLLLNFPWLYQQTASENSTCCFLYCALAVCQLVISLPCISFRVLSLTQCYHAHWLVLPLTITCVCVGVDTSLSTWSLN